MTLLLLVVAGLVLALRGPVRTLLGTVNGSDLSVTVLATTKKWAPPGLRHFGVRLPKAPQCRVLGATPGSKDDAFRVSCTAVASDGRVVRLSSANARMGGRALESVLGPWTLRVGDAPPLVLPCLTSDWQAPDPCGG